LKFEGNELKVIGKILKFSLMSPCLWALISFFIPNSSPNKGNQKKGKNWKKKKKKKKNPMMNFIKFEGWG